MEGSILDSLAIFPKLVCVFVAFVAGVCVVCEWLVAREWLASDSCVACLWLVCGLFVARVWLVCGLWLVLRDFFLRLCSILQI